MLGKRATISTDDGGILPLARQDDNVLPRAPRRGGRRRTVGEALAAVLIGNGVYFLFLFGHLPAPWQHQAFALDRGLGLDFLLCLAVYGVFRLWRALV